MAVIIFVTFIIFFSGNVFLFPLIPPRKKNYINTHFFKKMGGKNRGKKGEFFRVWGEFFSPSAPLGNTRKRKYFFFQCVDMGATV